MLKRITLALGLLLAPVAAFAQSSVLPYFYNSSGVKVPVGSSQPLPIVGSISASLAPFTPGLAGARGTPLTVTTSDSSGNLPTNTGSVIVSNVGSNPMYCNVNGIAATTSDQYISSSGGWFNFGIPAAITTLRCIATGGSTTANTVGGSGLGAGTGGGAGGGGGGAVTLASGAVASGAYSSGSIASGAVASGAIASGALASGAGSDGWDVTQGAKADAVCGTGSGTCSVIALIKFLNGLAASATPVTDQVGGAVTALVGDPCQTTAKTTLPITLATAAVKVIAVGVSAKKIYVCQLNLNNNAADTVAVFEATTATTCATSPVAVIGAGTTVATAGTGYNFGANGGISLGSGGFQVLQTSVNANDLCIAQSAATQLSGSITYVTR